MMDTGGAAKHLTSWCAVELLPGLANQGLNKFWLFRTICLLNVPGHVLTLLLLSKPIHLDRL